jgi:hypothetical protein
MANGSLNNSSQVARLLSLKATRVFLTVGVFAAAISFIYAWSQSYPLRSAGNLPLFFAINPLYWVSYVLLASCLCWYASRSGVSTAKTAVAAVAFFTLMHSLGYFFYTSPGPDQFFRNFAASYLNFGFINQDISQQYPWPGFFLLTNLFQEVTGLSQNAFSWIYVFLSGALLSLSIFFIARRHRLNPFWAVVAYSMTGYFFLNYQFAPQTLGLAFVMLLLQLDYAGKQGRSEKIVGVILLFAVAIFHAFIGVFYLVYLLVRAILDRSYFPRAALAASIILVSDVFLAATSFPGLTTAIFSSLLALLGFGEYLNAITVTSLPTSPFQQFSRLAVVGAGIVSAYGLVAAIRKQRLRRPDTAIITSSMFLAGVGVAVEYVGLRTLQLAMVAAGIGAGFFPQMLAKRRLLTLILLFLGISSIFPVLNANYQPYLYQTQDDIAAASFLSTRINSNPATTVFSPQPLAGYFSMISVNFYTPADLDSFNETVNYALTSPSAQVHLRLQGLSNPPAVDHLLIRGNLVYSSGNDLVYAAP